MTLIMATNRLPGNPVDHTHTFARWPTLWTHTQHQHRYLKYIDNQTNAGSPRVPLTAYYEFAVKCNFLIFSCDGLVGRGRGAARDHPVAICLFSSENFKGSPPPSIMRFSITTWIRDSSANLVFGRGAGKVCFAS